MIHGPSLGIGAVIASVVIIGVFFGFNQNETGLVLEPTPTVEQMGPAKLQWVHFWIMDLQYWGVLTHQSH